MIYIGIHEVGLVEIFSQVLYCFKEITGIELEKEYNIVILSHNGSSIDGAWVDDLNTIFLTVPLDSDFLSLLKITAHEAYHAVHQSKDEGATERYVKRILIKAKKECRDYL